ncbi:hypothetical protein AAZV13_02G155300 [Glycine max]
MVEMFPLNSADATYTKLRGMLSTLGDPFTRIISPKVLVLLVTTSISFFRILNLTFLFNRKSSNYKDDHRSTIYYVACSSMLLPYEIDYSNNTILRLTILF